MLRRTAVWQGARQLTDHALLQRTDHTLLCPRWPPSFDACAPPPPPAMQQPANGGSASSKWWTSRAKRSACELPSSWELCQPGPWVMAPVAPFS